MSNRKKLKKKPPPLPSYEDRPKIMLNEQNKHAVAKEFGYAIDWLNEVLEKAHAMGYEGVSFPPIPPRR